MTGRVQVVYIFPLPPGSYIIIIIIIIIKNVLI